MTQNPIIAWKRGEISMMDAMRAVAASKKEGTLDKLETEHKKYIKEVQSGSESKKNTLMIKIALGGVVAFVLFKVLKK